MRRLGHVVTVMLSSIMLMGCSAASLNLDGSVPISTGVASTRDENLKDFKTPTAMPTFTPVPTSTSTPPPATPSPAKKKASATPRPAAPTKTPRTQGATPIAGPLGPSPRDANGHIYAGDAKGRVVVEEWICLDDQNAQQTDASARGVLHTHQQDVKVVFRHCPRPLTAPGLEAARALEAAGEQGKFWDALTWLVGNAGEQSDEAYHQMAKALRLDAEAFDAYRESDQALQRVKADEGKIEAAAPPAGSAVTIDGKPAPYT